MWNALLLVLPLTLAQPGAVDDEKDCRAIPAQADEDCCPPCCPPIECQEKCEVGGNGAGFFDYDNDGDLDIFVTNGSARNFLFAKSGDGIFRVVPEDDDDDFELLRKKLKRLGEQAKSLQRELQKIQRTLGEMVDEHGGQIHDVLEGLLEEVIPEDGHQGRFKGLSVPHGKELFGYLKRAEGHLGKHGEALHDIWKGFAVPGPKKGHRQLRLRLGDDCGDCCGKCRGDCESGDRDCDKKGKIKKGKHAKVQIQRHLKRKGHKSPKIGKKQVYRLKKGKKGAKAEDCCPGEKKQTKILRRGSKGFGKGKVIIEHDGKRTVKEFDIGKELDLEGILEGIDLEDIQIRVRKALERAREGSDSEIMILGPGGLPGLGIELGEEAGGLFEVNLDGECSTISPDDDKVIQVEVETKCTPTPKKKVIQVEVEEECTPSCSKTQGRPVSKKTGSCPQGRERALF